jgi:hypothetical protein
LAAHFAAAELLMNKPLFDPAVRHFVLVALLSVICACCSGCQPNAKAVAAMRAAAERTALGSPS